MHYFPLIWQIYLRWTLNYMGNFNFIDNFSIVQITLPLAKKKNKKNRWAREKHWIFHFRSYRLQKMVLTKLPRM